MSFIASLFGGGGGGGGGRSAPAPIPAPLAPTTPTVVMPPPDRSDSELQAAAALQRKKYSGGNVTRTNLTGGLGVPSSSTYSAAASLLGG
jgi:hypothetical protein